MYGARSAATVECSRNLSLPLHLPDERAARDPLLTFCRSHNLVSALCHRWYEHYNMTIGLAIYDDRIEIENPGMMPPQMDMEHIEQAHYSSPHNPRMANVLYQTGYIENWGSGIQRIIVTCQKYDVALPTWQQMPGNVVVVTFARNTAQTELNDNNHFGKDFGKDFGKGLTDRQRITKMARKVARKIRLFN